VTQERTPADWERLATNLRVESQLLEALDLLEGLAVVVFKGTALTRLLYGDLRLRASSDNDLWVPASNMNEALTRLTRAGYLPPPHLDARAAMKRVGQVALWKNRDFNLAAVDLHAEPFSRRYFNVSQQLLLQNLTQVSIQGRGVLTFNPQLALVHLVAHFIQHHFEERLLGDIEQAWRKFRSELTERDWNELATATCSREALHFTLARFGAYLGRDETSLPWRARFTLNAFSSTSGPPRNLTRKLLSLFLVDPTRLPGQLLSAFALEADDLRSRYGLGSRPRLLLRHLWRSLER
jgi:hypothetical protein